MLVWRLISVALAIVGVVAVALAGWAGFPPPLVGLALCPLLLAGIVPLATRLVPRLVATPLAAVERDRRLGAVRDSGTVRIIVRAPAGSVGGVKVRYWFSELITESYPGGLALSIGLVGTRTVLASEIRAVRAVPGSEERPAAIVIEHDGRELRSPIVLSKVDSAPFVRAIEAMIVAPAPSVPEGLAPMAA